MRPAWQWTQTGLTSSRLLDWDEKFSYRSHVNLNKSQTGSRNFKPVCFWVSHIYLLEKKHVVSSRILAQSISSRFHANSCKNFIPVQFYADLSWPRSHVNTPLVIVQKTHETSTNIPRYYFTITPFYHIWSRKRAKYLVLINRAGGLYGRILTEVASTDRTQWGLYQRPRSRFSHTDRPSSVNKMFIIWPRTI